ncbi:amidohydrolase 2, precursor [Mycolicibacterium canariasense]|uniref:6-methylsalicylate decarboxylase n=1 Tax=Mycolicibacterium canariasense TaxID=228230 RepID=A0A100W9E8_MYCCR|nr:amidohydrolase family protein [Mycolicibacterium canariasense]MCV7212884.1 amidohydrolase family protein [Mycolicibacterium canariasense]GAS93856.1 amidohydrolase 2, precursor [Mycolicibacterium canariasense]
MAGWLDVHAHYVTARYRDECVAAGHAHPDGMPGMPDWSVEAALDVMGRSGIAAAVLSVSSPGVHFGDDSIGANAAARALAAHVNDVGAQLVTARPAIFGLAATLPLPDVDGALMELRRARDGLGADAVTLQTNYHGRYLSDREFAPVLAALDADAAVVLLHPTSPPGWQTTALGRPRPMLEFLFDTTRCVIDLVLSQALTRYPSIRWIVPHAGAVLPVVAHRVAAVAAVTGSSADVPGALATLYYDLAGLPLPVAFDALTTVVGPDRLLYGSDFPFTPAPAVVALAQALAQAPMLRSAELALNPGAAGASLFPRLSGSALPR